MLQQRVAVSGYLKMKKVFITILPFALLPFLLTTCAAQSRTLGPMVDLRVGEATRVAIQVYDGSRETHPSLSWLPQPPTCVSLSQASSQMMTATAVAPGICGVNVLVVTDVLQPFSNPVIFRVRERAVATSIVINSPSRTLFVGETIQFHSQVLDQYGEPMSATVSWCSTTTKVSIGSVSGIATGKKLGTANVYALVGTLQSPRTLVTVK